MPDLIRSSAEVLDEIQDALDELAPVSVDLRDASQPAGSLALAQVVAVSRILASVQVALDSISADGAVGSALDAIAIRQLVSRRPATPSRYTVRAVDGPATWVGGEVVRGGGAGGDARWRVITTGTVDADGDLVIEAVDTGPVSLSGATTLDVVTAVPGTTEVEWDPATDPAGQIGRDQETDGELRARLGIPGAVRSALLDETTWVRSVSVSAPPAGLPNGRAVVTVAPAPVGADQLAELAQILGERSLGIELVGSESVTWEAPGGDEVVVRYEVADTVTVPAVVQVTGSGIDTDAVEAAVLAYAATLDAADNVVRISRITQAAMSVQGVTDMGTVTLDGSAANYEPSPGVVPLLSVTVEIV